MANVITNTSSANFGGNFTNSVVIGQSIQNYEDASLFWDWLSPILFRQKHDVLISKKTANTATWLLNHASFLRWKDGEEKSIWLKGPMGYGKSVLTSAVIEATQNTPDMAVAYFYCDFTSSDSLDPLQILRSMLRQLLQTRQGNDAKAIRNDLCDTYYKRNLSLTWSNVKSYILNTASLCKKTLLIVDGIDECDDRSQSLLVKYLLELQSSPTSTIQFFISSRELQLVERHLAGILTISLHQELESVHKDIQEHISCELKDMEISQKIKDLVDHKIMSHEPQFRLVDCQLRLIRDCVTEMGVEKVLTELPMEMYEEYQRILNVIKKHPNPEQVEYAKKMFLWLLMATRPLRRDELLEAVSMDESLTSLPNNEAIVNPDSLFKVCGSFITVKPTGEIALAHLSVKEFFTSTRLENSTNSDFYTSRFLAEQQLSIVTLRYLLCHDFSQPPEEPSKICDKHHLLQYCALYWTTHINNFMSEVGKSIDKAKQASPPTSWFLSMIINLLNWASGTKGPCDLILRQEDLVYHIAAQLLTKRSNQSQPDPDLSPIFYPIYTGNIRLTRRLLQQCSQLSQRLMPQVGTPLMVAVERNDPAMIALLVDEFRVNINVECELREWARIEPFHLAVYLGNQQAFNALLERGAKVNSRAVGAASTDTSGMPILHTATLYDRVEIIEALLKLPEININEQDEQGCTAGFYAVQTKRKASLGLLISKGCDMTIKSNTGKTPLEIAMETEDRSLVCFIIDCIMEAGMAFPLSLEKLGQKWASLIMSWNPKFREMPGLGDSHLWARLYPSFGLPQIGFNNFLDNTAKMGSSVVSSTLWVND